MAEPSEALKRARRSIDGMPGVVTIGDWVWHEGRRRWALAVKLAHGHRPTAHVPAETSWYVLVGGRYPLGDVEFFPAREGGIVTTFPHQRFNDLDGTAAWRKGLLCLTRPEKILGPTLDDDEPSDPAARMRWRIDRALAWLRDAAAGTLTHEGEHFEIPDFPDAEMADETIAFQEDEDTFAFWSARSERHGVVAMTASERARFVYEFRDARAKVIHRNEWGGIGAWATSETLALWIRLDGLPVTDPWRPPATFGELRSILKGQGVDLDTIVLALADQYRKDLRNGRETLLLLGFPIPKRFGEQPFQLHWQAVRLPKLSQDGSKGFRRQSLGQRDRLLAFHDGALLKWKRSENWTQKELTARGSLPDSLRSRRIVVIGTGALGSAVSELLVRGACNDLTLVDDDTFRAGNAVRHVLTMTAVGAKKVGALAARLSLLSPHARIEAIDGKVQSLTGEALAHLAGADLVIDATADEDVPSYMRDIPWGGTPNFVHLSFGYEAKRLFCYFVPMAELTGAGFIEALRPWLEAERTTTAAAEFPREGVGCWNPVFPARADDVWLLASVAAKWLDRMHRSPRKGLTVYEQNTSDKDGITLKEVTVPSV